MVIAEVVTVEDGYMATVVLGSVKIIEFFTTAQEADLWLDNVMIEIYREIG